MEKIKNLLVPGKSKDDETLYGSGQTEDNQTKHVGTHGGLAGEGSHFTQAKDNTAAVPVEQTGNPTTTGTTEPLRTTGEGSHFGQVGGTAPGMTAGQTENQTSTATSGLPSTTSTTTATDNAPITTATGAENAPIAGTNTTHGNHLERDAAAVGTAGAVGEGVHHHHHHHHQGTAYNDTVPGSTTSTGERVPETSTTGHDHHHTGEHHLGRDAAALGAAGATGEAVHHHHEKEKTVGLAGQDQLGSTTMATPVGKNDYDREAVLADHERLKTQTGGVGYIPNTGVPSSNVAGTETHRHGKDVALGAGAVGAAGVAEHEHHKHHAGTGQTTSTTTGEQFPSNTTSGTNQLSKDTDPYASNTLGNTDPASTHGQTHDHHYGRDAAVGAGVGGVAYEADKHFKHDKDLTREEKEAKKEHKHELKEEKKEHKQELKEEKKEHKKGGLLSFLHRDKSKKYTPEEEAEFDRQEREHTESHKGRDAALGAGAAGAAYEAEKHHHEHKNTDKPLPTAPGNQGVGTGVVPESGLDSDKASTTAIHQGHVGHTGTLEGATAGAGAGAGAAGLAEAEHVKHQDHAHGAVPLHEKPLGTDIGDKLHGVERNRGVPGSSGFPGTEGFDTGVPQSGLATGATTGATTGGMTQPTATGAEYGSTGHNTHLGRDATAGAAVGGATHLGHRKQDSGYAPGDKYAGETGVTGASPLQGQTYPQESGVTKSDIATQPAGVQSGVQPGLDNNNTFGSGLADSGTGTTTTDGRNRLHKEPPVGHTTGI